MEAVLIGFAVGKLSPLSPRMCWVQYFGAALVCRIAERNESLEPFFAHHKSACFGLKLHHQHAFLSQLHEGRSSDFFGVHL